MRRRHLISKTIHAAGPPPWTHNPLIYNPKKTHLKSLPSVVNTLRPRQNGRHFADDTFKRIFLNEDIRISIKISLMFIPKGPANNIPTLVQIMAWRRSGDKPLSEPMMVSLLTHICVARPQWVKHPPDTNLYSRLRLVRAKFSWELGRYRFSSARFTIVALCDVLVTSSVIDCVISRT